MRIAVCDDEAIFRDKIIESIEQYYKDIDLVLDEFTCGEDIINYYESVNKNYNIIILDIEMKQIDGIKTAERLHEIDDDALIIFLTSHNEFAPMGYEVSAFRFLTKPINEKKLIESIESARNQMNSTKTIIIHIKDEDYVLKVKNIIYVESQNKEVRVRTFDNEYTQRYNINDYEKELKEDGFFRVHRGYLLNMNYVKECNKRQIILDNNEVIPLSRLKEKQFKQALYSYIKRTAK